MTVALLSVAVALLISINQNGVSSTATVNSAACGTWTNWQTIAYCVMPNDIPRHAQTHCPIEKQFPFAAAHFVPPVNGFMTPMMNGIHPVPLQRFNFEHSDPSIPPLVPPPYHHGNWARHAPPQVYVAAIYPPGPNPAYGQRPFQPYHPVPHHPPWMAHAGTCMRKRRAILDDKIQDRNIPPGGHRIQKRHFVQINVNSNVHNHGMNSQTADVGSSQPLPNINVRPGSISLSGPPPSPDLNLNSAASEGILNTNAVRSPILSPAPIIPPPIIPPPTETFAVAAVPPAPILLGPGGFPPVSASGLENNRIQNPWEFLRSECGHCLVQVTCRGRAITSECSPSQELQVSPCASPSQASMIACPVPIQVCRSQALMNVSDSPFSSVSHARLRSQFSTAGVRPRHVRETQQQSHSDNNANVQTSRNAFLQPPTMVLPKLPKLNCVANEAACICCCVPYVPVRGICVIPRSANATTATGQNHNNGATNHHHGPSTPESNHHAGENSHHAARNTIHENANHAAVSMGNANNSNVFNEKRTTFPPAVNHHHNVEHSVTAVPHNSAVVHHPERDEANANVSHPASHPGAAVPARHDTAANVSHPTSNATAAAEAKQPQRSPSGGPAVAEAHADTHNKNHVTTSPVLPPKLNAPTDDNSVNVSVTVNITNPIASTLPHPIQNPLVPGSPKSSVGVGVVDDNAVNVSVRVNITHENTVQNPAPPTLASPVNRPVQHPSPHVVSDVSSATTHTEHHERDPKGFKVDSVTDRSEFHSDSFAELPDASVAFATETNSPRRDPQMFHHDSPIKRNQKAYHHRPQPKKQNGQQKYVYPKADQRRPRNRADHGHHQNLKHSHNKDHPSADTS